MTHWQHYLISHYTQRLKEETRPKAKQFIRQTLKELKHVPDNFHPCCSCIHGNVLASSITHRQAKAFFENS
jgi:hypothetical protein